MKHHETSWNIMKRHETSWNIMKQHETAWNMNISIYLAFFPLVQGLHGLQGLQAPPGGENMGSMELMSSMEE